MLENCLLLHAKPRNVKCSFCRYYEPGGTVYSHFGSKASGVLFLLKGYYFKRRSELFDHSSTMGCIKSKGTLPGSHTILEDGSKAIGAYNGGYGGDAPALVQARPGVTSSTSTVILDFAHRLSQEILDQAVKQWAVTESKYSDIPFIESDVP